MPYKEREVEKLYYTIGEVSQLLNENPSLVRFWSTKFQDFIKPVRNKKGNRLFTAKDVENFRIIYYLVKERGMTLEGAYNRMKDNRTGIDKRVDVITKLNSIKAKLLTIQDNLTKQAEEDEM